MNISQTKPFKPLGVHEHTHKIQTYCERKKNHVTVLLMCSNTFTTKMTRAATPWKLESSAHIWTGLLAGGKATVFLKWTGCWLKASSRPKTHQAYYIRKTYCRNHWLQMNIPLGWFSVLIAISVTGTSLCLYPLGNPTFLWSGNFWSQRVSLTLACL